MGILPKTDSKLEVLVYQTRVVSYVSKRAMKRGVARMTKQGWEVVNTSVESRGYGCVKTVFYGCLFLPLALLGKRPNHYLVNYRKLV